MSFELASVSVLPHQDCLIRRVYILHFCPYEVTAGAGRTVRFDAASATGSSGCAYLRAAQSMFYSLAHSSHLRPAHCVDVATKIFRCIISLDKNFEARSPGKHASSERVGWCVAVHLPREGLHEPLFLRRPRDEVRGRFR